MSSSHSLILSNGIAVCQSWTDGYVFVHSNNSYIVQLINGENNQAGRLCAS